MALALPTVQSMNTASPRASTCFTDKCPQAALEGLKKRFVDKLAFAVYPVVTLLAVAAAVSSHA